ncbi:Abi family protein [Klebsiella pneumoniae]|nr:Abi family protein [Klebsiella pneumoniae]
MIAAKPHKEYRQQLELLLSRGMVIHDSQRAMRKLSQVGYYRLSGFWYTSRIIRTSDEGLSFRSDDFLPGTSFEQAYDLYLFDKKLRMLMMDALERIEIHIRSVIAHEVGRYDPLAYRKESYINQRLLNDGRNGKPSTFEKWRNKLDLKIQDSRDECIMWHLSQQKEIPFWVAVETWDFGQMSKYYAMLNGGMQAKIIKRLQLDNKQTLTKWLQCLNLLRNRCAHHSRIWNRKHAVVPIPKSVFFDELKIDARASERLYSAICIMWYLVKMIGPGSTWIRQVAELFDKKPNMPGCSYESMGVPKSGFPKARFGDALGFVNADNDPLHEGQEGA